VESALLLISGFGAFEGVEENPSGALARTLDGDPGVVGVELPVTFRGSAQAWDEALAGLAPRRPVALLSLGVHPRASFRLERFAGATLSMDRPDCAGETGAEVSGSMGGGPGDLATTFELEPLADALRAGGWEGEVEHSQDAGGFVCQRIYRHVLVRGAELGVPGLFLHVPPLAAAPLERQAGPVRALVDALRAQV
jgi:pyrrolidone-carboxylate peptidase